MASSLRRFLYVFLLSASFSLHAGKLSVNGFGTVGLACFSNEDADFRHNSLSEGAGATRTCDMGLDSKIGLQSQMYVNEYVELHLQGVSYKHSDNSFDPGLTVASIIWRPNEEWRFRVGRFQNPNFIHSDSRLIGYTQPWVRPPREVYGSLPAYDVDGGDLYFLYQLDELTLTFNTGLYSASETLNVSGEPFDAEASDNIYLNVTGNAGDLTWKVGVIYGETSAQPDSITSFVNTLTFFGQPSLAKEFSHIDKTSYYIYGGFWYESLDWLFTGEYVYSDFESYFNENHGAYLTVGRRFNDWLLHGTWAWRTREGLDISRQVVNSQLSAIAAGIKTVTDLGSHDIGIGINYTVSENMLLKMQLNYIIPEAGSSGASYANTTKDYDIYNPDNDILFSLSLDFIF